MNDGNPFSALFSYLLALAVGWAMVQGHRLTPIVLSTCRKRRQKEGRWASMEKSITAQSIKDDELICREPSLSALEACSAAVNHAPGDI